MRLVFLRANHITTVAQSHINDEELADAQAAIANLYGDRQPPEPASPAPANPQQRMDQAVIAASKQLKHALGAAVDDSVLARALDLVLSNAVTLHLDGKASVQQGDYAYATEQGLCSCPDFEARQAPCQHVLAAEIHRRAQAIIEGSYPGPAAVAPARPTAAAAWDVHEAQTSCSLKMQLSFGEVIFTMRATSDEEVDERLCNQLAFFQALEAELAGQKAVSADPPAQAEAAAESGVLEEMVNDAMQRAMQAWAAAQPSGNGQASGNRQAADASPAAEEPESTGDRFNERGDKWCKLCRVWMKQRTNAKGSWHSHWLDAEKRWCRGT